MDFNSIQMKNALLREQIKQKYGIQKNILEMEYQSKHFELKQNMNRELLDVQKKLEKQLEQYQNERDARKQENKNI